MRGCLNGIHGKRAGPVGPPFGVKDLEGLFSVALPDPFGSPPGKDFFHFVVSIDHMAPVAEYKNSGILVEGRLAPPFLDQEGDGAMVGDHGGEIAFPIAEVPLPRLFSQPDGPELVPIAGERKKQDPGGRNLREEFLVETG